jgi:hypothetical protein
MTRGTRRIIFCLFLIAFIILVPSIILYALGYGFDFDKKTFVNTGAIYLKSYPSKAEIYIDDKLRGKTNEFIGHLIPKVYEIKIIKEDYHPWQKNLTIKSGLVSKADNIFLVPFNPKISLVDEKSEIYSSFENPYLMPISQLTELIKKKSKYTIFDISNLKFDSKKEKIYFLSKNNLYSLELDKENLENSLLSDVLTPNVVNYTIYKNGIIYLEYFTGQIYELDLSSLESAVFFDQVFPSFNQGKWILSDDNEKLLCQKEKSVEILWLKGFAEDSIIRKKGGIEKIDFGEKINNVIWYPKTDEHLIVATNNSILVTELDGRPPRNTINFITTEKPQIEYDAKPKTLYFLSQDRLYETEL